jgi:hypothetical protein
MSDDHVSRQLCHQITDGGDGPFSPFLSSGNPTTAHLIFKFYHWRWVRGQACDFKSRHALDIPEAFPQRAFFHFSAGRERQRGLERLCRWSRDNFGDSSAPPR